MATQIATVTDENPLKKFDSPVLKGIDNTQLDATAGAPRAMFLPANMGEAMELAKLMASSNFVPAHLRSKAGDCLAVVMQAGRWAMDPFAVANKSYFVNDRIAYEAQLVNAVLNSSGLLDGRLHLRWEGEGNDLVCFVTGKIKGDPQTKERRVPIRNITTRNSPLWKQDPDQQLGYYASRAWGRLYVPEVLMGVYTPDEIDETFSARGIAEAATLNPQPITGQALLEQAREDEPDLSPQPATPLPAEAESHQPADEAAAPAKQGDGLLERISDIARGGRAGKGKSEPEGRDATEMGEQPTLDQAKAALDKCETESAGEPVEGWGAYIVDDDWRDIASAPGDGTSIWVASPYSGHGTGGMEPVRRRTPNECWSNIYTERWIDWAPTHWRPLPRLPRQEIAAPQVDTEIAAVRGEG